MTGGRAGAAPGSRAARARPPPLGIDLGARVLYRDGLVLVLDKPAGIAVHAGPGGGRHLEQGFDALRFGLPHPPALAHRLDRDTAGCLVLGRHAKALRRLNRLFAEGRVAKTYWAVVAGAPPAASGRIEAALAKRSTRDRGWRMAVDPAGVPAITEYRVVAAGAGQSWLELRPLTGRTHQIRVHCAAALGCPVAGDPIYGGAGSGAGPLLLLARAIALPLYPNRPPIAVTAPVPAHMLAALCRLGYNPAQDRPDPDRQETSDDLPL